MRMSVHAVASLALLTIAGVAGAQAPGGANFRDIGRELPLEGAPLAIPGPYEVVSEPAAGLEGQVIWRPADLSAFPDQDRLPVMAWGNGGCGIDSTRYGGFLGTIASHGFLVISTVPAEGQTRGTPELMIAAFDWAEAENARAGSPLNGKIAIDRMAAMGQSCGGFMSVSAGADPRVGTIGMFNSAVQPPNPNGRGGRGGASTDALAAVHGPILLINGGEVDFMYEPAQQNFEIIDHVPVFYGARFNAGHTATVFHPGGGEFANVASNWLRYVFKDDAEAAKMFVGDECSLCTLDTWETMAKRLD
jgi:hypothetical protein